jgi:hypothetical protein
LPPRQPLYSLRRDESLIAVNLSNPILLNFSPSKVLDNQ